MASKKILIAGAGIGGLAAACCLLKKGFEAFSPSYAAQNEWRNQVHEVEAPLFPGYVFVRFDPRVRMPILTTPGVRQVVGYGKIPVPIPIEEITAVREAVSSKLKVEPCQYLAVGSRVQIVRGPLAGVEGILEETRSSCRVIVSVSLIQRSIRVEVDRTMLSAGGLQCEQANVGHLS